MKNTHYVFASVLNRNTLMLIRTFLTMSLFLIGCDGDRFDFRGSNVKLLKTIVIDGDITSVVEFEYDSQGRIAKQIQNNLTATYTYDRTGDLIKLIWESEHPGITETQTFTRTRNRVTVTGEIPGVTYETIIELDTQGRPVTVLGERDFTFKYQNGNIWKMTISVDPSVEDDRYTFTYDNEKSPLLNCHTPQWYLAIAFMSLGFPFIGLNNNPTLVDGSFTEGGLSGHFVYAYDREGYPSHVKVEKTESSGIISRTYNYTISYIYTTQKISTTLF